MYINSRGNWKNLKFNENTPPRERRVSSQFLVFPIPLVLYNCISTRKMFILPKYKLAT